MYSETYTVCLSACKDYLSYTFSVNAILWNHSLYYITTNYSCHERIVLAQPTKRLLVFTTCLFGINMSTTENHKLEFVFLFWLSRVSFPDTYSLFFIFLTIEAGVPRFHCFLHPSNLHLLMDHILQILQANDIAECLNTVQYAVGTTEGLNEAVHFQILVNPQGIQRRGVKTGQEHIHHDK